MPDASVIIITRNRKEIAGRAIRSALQQCGEIEVVLIDDGSGDQTLEMVQKEFPTVRVARSETQLGYIVQRNRAVEMCTAAFVFSLDDDAEFVDPNTIQATLKLFQNPCIGAVAIPFINRNADGSESRMVPPVPDGQQTWVSNTFIGTAFAVRRDIFLDIGGFQPVLFHWGEESEYCQRLLNAGYFVALGAEGMIHHYPAGVGKYSRAVNRYIYRNGILTIWFNAPWYMVMPLMFVRAATYLASALRRPAILLTVLEGFWMAFKTILTRRGLRKPLSPGRYRLWHRLRREKPVPLPTVLPALDGM